MVLNLGFDWGVESSQLNGVWLYTKTEVLVGAINFGVGANGRFGACCALLCSLISQSDESNWNTFCFLFLLFLQCSREYVLMRNFL